MGDIFGKVFGALMAFILLFMAPFTWATLSNEMVARRTIMNEMQSFIDQTIDSRKVTDEQLEELYLGVSGLGPIVDTEVKRYVKVVDPDPNTPGGIYTTYVLADDNTKFNQGDKIKLRVKAIGYTGSERLLRSTIGLWLPAIDYTFVGRVR